MDEPMNDASAPPPVTSRRRRVFTGVAVAAALAAGGLTVAAVNPLGVAGAQDGRTTTSVASAPAAAAPAAARGRKVLGEALAALVKDGTLTQAQADAVTARVAETAQDLGAQRRVNRMQRRQEMLSTAASTLGMTVDDLRGELRSGKTLADVAKEKGVSTDKLVDALVAAAGQRIDQAVAAGKLDATKASQMKQKLSERITSLVQQGRGSRPGGGRG